MLKHFRKERQVRNRLKIMYVFRNNSIFFRVCITASVFHVTGTMPTSRNVTTIVEIARDKTGKYISISAVSMGYC